ncbi:MAG TPA: hypothetical protein VGM90_37555 [Kofleriaceae bacterium]
MKFREVALIAATRGMLGIGAGLLAAPLLHKDTRRTLGVVLVAVGVLSTIPLAVRMIRRLRAERDELTPDLDTSTKKPGEPISRSRPAPVMH